MNKRSSNYELLRIIAIAFITFNHINTYCDVKAIGIVHPFNLVLSFLFGAGGKFGCNVFLLISAYFLAKKDSRPAAIFRIFFQTFFYLLVLDAVWLILIRESFSLRSFALQIVKTLVGKYYWYAFAYFILLLAVPLLRAWMDLIRHKAAFLLAAGLLICILPTVTVDYLLIPGQAGQLLGRLFHFVMYQNVIWFWYVFCVVYYLRNKCPAVRIPVPVSGTLFALSYLAMALIEYRIYLKGSIGDGRTAQVFSSNYIWIRNSYSLLCILSAACLFLCLKGIRMSYHPVINKLGVFSFGIYLLQTHPLMRPVIFGRILDFKSIYENSLPVVYVLAACLLVLLIVLIGSGIEFFRSGLEQKLFRQEWMEKIILKVHGLLQTFYQFILKNRKDPA